MDTRASIYKYFKVYADAVSANELAHLRKIPLDEPFSVRINKIREIREHARKAHTNIWAKQAIQLQRLPPVEQPGLPHIQRLRGMANMQFADYNSPEEIHNSQIPSVMFATLD